MNSRTIGRIVSIGQRGVFAEIFEDMGQYVNTTDGPRFVGEVGSYISIHDIGRTIVAEIEGIEDSPENVGSEFSKPKSTRRLALGLVGEINDDVFCFGVSKMPLIYSEVSIISQNEMRKMLETTKAEIEVDHDKHSTRAKQLSIGNSVIFPEYDVRVDIDKFFGFHFSVFGNTGAGKSNTVARLLQNVFAKQNYSAVGAKFVVLDSNGEYAKAFSKLTETNPDIECKGLTATDETVQNRLELPVWALSVDDWAILLHASEKTQFPVLKRAIDIAKVFFQNGSDDQAIKTKNHLLSTALIGILNSSDSSPSKSDKIKAILSVFHTEAISLDTTIFLDGNQGTSFSEYLKISYGEMKGIETLVSWLSSFVNPDGISQLRVSQLVPFSLNDFSEALELATLYEGSVSSQRIQEYTSTLAIRLQSLQDGVVGSLLSKTGFTTVDDYMTSILGSNQLLNIDISLLDDATGEVVVRVFAKLLLDYLRKRRIKADCPINMIVEEAHRFIRNEQSYGVLGYNIFERIAKEGRKYGLLLGISSQRPSELSKTVVSQCSNFIIHRVQNPDDLDYISRMVPYVNRSTINRLTFLQTGHALVFGSAINLPTLTTFKLAIPSPDSENARISEKWYVPKDQSCLQ
jgi:DNA helicase HerA-like ATPase